MLHRQRKERKNMLPQSVRDWCKNYESLDFGLKSLFSEFDFLSFTWISSFNSWETGFGVELVEALLILLLFTLDGRFLIRCDKGASDGPLYKDPNLTILSTKLIIGWILALFSSNSFTCKCKSSKILLLSKESLSSLEVTEKIKCFILSTNSWRCKHNKNIKCTICQLQYAV